VAYCIDEKIQGRVYSSLPLPIYSGLNVHVNSFFEMGSNRREIWQSKTSDDDIRDTWNKTMISVNIKNAILNLVDYLVDDPQIEESKKFKSILDAFPISKNVGKSIFYVMLKPFYNDISRYKIFPSPVSKEFFTLNKFSFFSPSLLKSFNESIVNDLLSLNNLIELPNEIIDEFKNQGLSEKVVDETSLKSYYQKLILEKEEPTKENIFNLWELCVKEPSTNLQRFSVITMNDEIKPLSKITITKKKKSKVETIHPNTFYLMKNEKLLPLLDNDMMQHILHPKFSENISKCETPLADIGIQTLDVIKFEKLLSKSSFSYLKHSDNIPIEKIPLKWLEEFWKYIGSLEIDVKEIFGEWPFIPTTNNLRKISFGKNVIHQYVPYHMKQQLSSIFEILKEVKCPFLLEEFQDFTKLRYCVSQLSESYVLNQLSETDCKKLKGSQKDEILKFMNPNSLKDFDIKMLSALPLFETISGNYQSLNSSSCVITSSNIPFFESTVSVLKEKMYFHTLYRTLNVKMLTSESKIYEDLIFPSFNSLKNEIKIVRSFLYSQRPI
jgi:hypothetical protein